MGLTRTALARPVFILMLMIGAFIMGYRSYKGMRIELQPEVSFGNITVTTIYPGAGPEEINTLVSRRIEDAISGVNGIREVTSTSQEGRSTVSAAFELGTDINQALNDVRTKVDTVIRQLPEGVERPTIDKFDTSSQPILYIAVNSKRLDRQQLRDLADNQLADRFQRIAGVASASVAGGDVRELQVRIRRDRLLTYGIGIAQVQRAVAAATLNVPSGRVVAGNEEYSVRVLGEFRTPDDLRNMLITISSPNNPNSKSKIVRLSDIASVVDAVEERTQYSRLNGRDTVLIVIQKTREGNAIDISKAADPIIAQAKTEFGIDMIKTTDQAKDISASLEDLTFALMFGIVLVALIVYVFLHNLRGTLIVATAIPVCIFGAFVAMRAMGFTINNMSMLSLSLAIGVLVDDAIVVLENIYRHLQKGEDPKDAALNGRAEIGLAAIAITLADVVVFLPIAFMGGIVGQFFKPLGLGFASAVILSLFVSFTITPMLAARWYRAGEDLEHPKGRFARWFERGFAKLQDFYRGRLRWALAHRWTVFIAGNVVLLAVFMMIGGSFAPSARQAALGTLGPVQFILALGVVVSIVYAFRQKPSFKYMIGALLFALVLPLGAVIGYGWASWKKEPIFKFAFLPPTDSGQVAVNIQMPPGSSLAATQRVVSYVEGIAMKHPDAKYVLSRVGTLGSGGFGGSSLGSQYAQVSIPLYDKEAMMERLMFWRPKPPHVRTKSDAAVAGDLLEQIGRVPGATISVTASGGQGFGAPIQMSFKGDNRAQLLETVSKIKNQLSSGIIPGVINVDISSKPGKPELVAVPDRLRLADAGLTVADLGNTMRTLYEGNDDAKFRTGGREYDIRVMMDLADRNNPEILSQVPVVFNQGEPVYLGQVATLRRGTGADKIERRDRSEEVRLSADLLSNRAAGTVQQQISAWLERDNMVPPGIQVKPLGQADAQARESGFLLGALGLGFVLVYMVLASLYNNLLYPFIIQLSQPQAMVGALLALMITDKTLNIVGMIGIITLVGLVGKNAILLVDYTNTLRERGYDREEAILEAGPTRLRPIMMTTLALILGTLPVALAIGRGSEFRETIGITIIGGITLSTLLTLLVIPCSYTIFDDLSGAMSRGRRRKRELRVETTEPAPREATGS